MPAHPCRCICASDDTLAASPRVSFYPTHSDSPSGTVHQSLTPSSPLHSFLGYVDLLGTTYSAPSIATGYGAYIAIPLLRAAVDGKQDQLTEEAARELLHECMRVLFYRDARSLDKVCTTVPRCREAMMLTPFRTVSTRDGDSGRCDDLRPDSA